MLTGKRFWTLALILGLCVLATAGCRRKKSGTTINNSSIFTTDNFPGAPVQDGNVSDDKRAFSISGDSFSGGLVCTHNGDRGTIMVTYLVDEQVFAHYFDGSSWTIGVALRHFDTYVGTTDAGEIVHAFINTSNDGRSDAEDRDGDCLIFWNARDFDSDGAGVDEENQALYVTTFDVSHYQEADQNHGFDIEPLDPGFFEAQRISSLEGFGEDVIFQGLVTDGLCGEARWQDGNNVYSYGDDTFAIFVFWHELEEKSVGVFDDVTTTSGFDLDLVVDEEFPLLASIDTEISPVLFGADDSTAACRESIAGRNYASYNDVLMRRVRTAGASALGNGAFGALGTSYYYTALTSTDEDVTMQYTFFNFGAFTLFTDTVNTVNPDSDGTAGDIDEMNSDFFGNDDIPGLIFDTFLGYTGQGMYGSDEGLSCITIFSKQVYVPDDAVDVEWADEDAENNLIITEISEYIGGSPLEIAIVQSDDLAIVDNEQVYGAATQISRNGDYIWILWVQINQLGTNDDFNLTGCEYLTTRLDSDGLPVPIPLMATTLGLPIVVEDDVEDGFNHRAWAFQDNLGYICGQQSNALQMSLFFFTSDSTIVDSLVYWVRLTADVDGTVGGEFASVPSLIINEDNVNFHEGGVFGVNPNRNTFNATDAGRDGDLLYVYTFDDNATNGLSDVFIAAGRLGVTAAAPIVIGSGTSTRQAQYAGDRLGLVATPPGQNIGFWDVSSTQYDEAAHHGPDFIHVIFREAETASYPVSTGGNTETGYALRTRQYDTDLSGGTFGDDFTPSAGTVFRKPFDLDLPFTDPDTSDDADVMAVLICENRVGIVFTENEHIYWQECNPGGNEIGWRTEEGGDSDVDAVSDPALVDDDTDIQVQSFIDVCTPSCTCCDLTGAAIFWTKVLDQSNADERLQVRMVDTDDSH